MKFNCLLSLSVSRRRERVQQRSFREDQRARSISDNRRREMATQSSKHEYVMYILRLVIYI